MNSFYLKKQTCTICKSFTKKSKHCLAFFDREKSILHETYCLCIPSWLLFLPTPNSKRYPRSFSKPLVWAAVWPLPSSARPCPSCAPLPEASLAGSLPVIYLQEQHSSGAGLDQMTMISQMEAQRWEAWPILWSATHSDRCRSGWINCEAKPPARSAGLDTAPER